MKSPKRDSANRLGRAQWYPYYAGYAPGFVEEAISYGKDSGMYKSILDPWNGSGTTTQIAAESGLSALGYDINPVMVIVARARLLDANVFPSISSLLDDICLKASGYIGSQQEDPLTHWLSTNSARAFRAVDFAISVLLIDAAQPLVRSHLEEIDSISSLASFFYVALFRTLRLFLKTFEGSNPTWIRDAKQGQAKLRIPSSKVLEKFRNEVLSMLHAGETETNKPTGTVGICVGQSSALPVPTAAIDLVISSPPYCTRIDYVIKTKPELAILGYCDSQLRALRDTMLGTPTIQSSASQRSVIWGKYCNRILTQIEGHRSHASLSYYAKTYIQYFDGLSKSIAEISRTLKPKGLSFLVVQNSYYKDIKVDLARIADEMAVNAGLTVENRFDFSSGRSMADLNTAAREYQNEHLHVESILVWRKAS